MHHQVYFWLNNPDSDEDRAALIAGLKTLRQIDVVDSYDIGVPAATEERNVVDASFSVSVASRFAGLAEQKIYQDHPVHLAFVEQCSPLWRKVVVYDSVDV